MNEVASHSTVCAAKRTHKGREAKRRKEEALGGVGDDLEEVTAAGPGVPAQTAIGEESDNGPKSGSQPVPEDLAAEEKAANLAAARAATEKASEQAPAEAPAEAPEKENEEGGGGGGRCGARSGDRTGRGHRTGHRPPPALDRPLRADHRGWDEPALPSVVGDAGPTWPGSGHNSRCLSPLSAVLPPVRLPA